MSCSITKQGVKKQIRDKGLAVAKSVNNNFRISGIGEILLPLSTKDKSRSTPTLARKIVDKAVRQINKELNTDPKKFGVVFGGVTYSDGAAIQVVVTPQLFNAYLVKNKERTYEEAYERPLSFYKGDIALQEQEARDLSQLEADFEAIENLVEDNLSSPVTPIVERLEPTIKPTLNNIAPIKLSLDPNQAPDKGDLDSLGFTEVSCNV